MYKIGDSVTTKKNHPCGNNVWTIIRVGADIKIKCDKCERIVMIPLSNFASKIKSVKEG